MEETGRFPRYRPNSTIFRYFVRLNKTRCDRLQKSIESTNHDVSIEVRPIMMPLRLQVGALCFDGGLTQIARLTATPQGISVRRAGISGGRNAQLC